MFNVNILKLKLHPISILLKVMKTNLLAASVIRLHEI